MAPALASAAAPVKVDIAPSPAEVDFWQHHPLQIAMCLRKVMSHHEKMTVTFDGEGQYSLRILDVDSRKGRFTFDVSNVDADNVALLGSDELSFASLPGTIETRFGTGGAVKVYFDERPAFEVAFPARLYFAQRREHFRVHTPTRSHSVEPFMATGLAPDGKPFHFELHDMSLGGIAMKTSERIFAALPLGTVLRHVEIYLGQAGSAIVDLEVMSPRTTTTATGETQHIVGCRFIERLASTERLLQRVVMHLETSRQSAALRS